MPQGKHGHVCEPEDIKTTLTSDIRNANIKIEAHKRKISTLSEHITTCKDYIVMCQGKIDQLKI